MLLLLLEVLILRHLLTGEKKVLVDKRKFSLPVKKILTDKCKQQYMVT